jgi:uncharacterized protein GlcG (DUF336 family)
MPAASLKLMTAGKADLRFSRRLPLGRRPFAGWLVACALAAAVAQAAQASQAGPNARAAPANRDRASFDSGATAASLAATSAGASGTGGAEAATVSTISTISTTSPSPASPAASAAPRRYRKPPPPPPPPKNGPPPVCPDGQLALAAGEVAALAQAAAAAIDAPTLTVAVVDRAGQVLGLFRKPGTGAADDDRAVGLARTGAFFSNDQAPLSSRTVRFISGIHFPPGIANTGSGPLYGIESTNRGCPLGVSFLPGRAVAPAGSLGGGPCQGAAQAGCGTGPVTGKADLFDSDEGTVDPGGVPLFRGSAVVGGIGVAGAPPAAAEFAAFTAASGGFLPAVAAPGVVFVNGIRLPFVTQRRRPAGVNPGTAAGGSFAVGPVTGGCVPEGYLAGPAAGSRLSPAEVGQVVQQAAAAAARTRAQIRLPIGSRTRMVIAVSDLDGSILALYRMPDATVFSIDVAVAKSRNVVYLSAGSASAQADLPGVPPGTAVTNRTIGFGAQPLFPPGIDGSGAGPFFGLLQQDAANPCTQGSQAAGPRQNGVVFFPGSVPLYHGNVLAGGLGVSGDGVDQDDYVTFLGAQGFLPPESLWADRVFVGGVRLPFLKFPRNPED